MATDPPPLSSQPQPVRRHVDNSDLFKGVVRPFGMAEFGLVLVVFPVRSLCESVIVCGRSLSRPFRHVRIQRLIPK
jgi:hypothetical protein